MSKRKNNSYDFKGFRIGEKRMIPNSNSSAVLNCARSYCRKRELAWDFKTFTIGQKKKEIYLMRVA